MDLLFDPQIWIAFTTLATLEIVLGIDNLIFLSIISQRLPQEQQPLARRLGLIMALGTRLLLLLTLAWIMGLTAPLFTAFEENWSWRDIILVLGGLFLLYKSTNEIHHEVEGGTAQLPAGKAVAQGFVMVVLQIGLLDIIFSLDSVLTAVGMVEEVPVMVAAIVAAMTVMFFAAEPVSGFVERHPTVKMLALAFLLMIGVALVADGLHFHIPKGYLYFGVAFSILVESLNLLRNKRHHVKEGKG